MPWSGGRCTLRMDRAFSAEPRVVERHTSLGRLGRTRAAGPGTGGRSLCHSSTAQLGVESVRCVLPSTKTKTKPHPCSLTGDEGKLNLLRHSPYSRAKRGEPGPLPITSCGSSQYHAHQAPSRIFSSTWREDLRSRVEGELPAKGG